MAMAGANQGSVSSTARDRVTQPTRTTAQGTGQSNAGTTNRPEGQPGTAPGAQHTVRNPGTRDDHVDPGDEGSVRPDVD